MSNDKDLSAAPDFKGRVVVVTGAGAGIGHATALLLAAGGASLICLDRDSAGVADVCSRIEDTGGQAEAVIGDVRDAATFEAVRVAAADRFGRIDVLANIAGAWEVKGFEELDAASWQRLLDINLTSVFLAVRTLLPLLRQSDAGRIVNVAATDGIRGSTAMPHYAAAKAGVVNLTKSQALELAQHGILVNCVSPGAIATPRAAQDDWLEERRKLIPLRRLGTARDVANLIAFLASRANTFTTGAIVPVNGGMYMP